MVVHAVTQVFNWECKNMEEHQMYQHFSLFQERNKPKQPPKVPKAAPFFLPTIPGLEPKFAIPEEKEKVRDIYCV